MNTLIKGRFTFVKKIKRGSKRKTKERLLFLCLAVKAKQKTKISALKKKRIKNKEESAWKKRMNGRADGGKDASQEINLSYKKEEE